MTTTIEHVRGIDPADYGVTMTPELHDFLEAVDQEAFDSGLESGEESERTYQDDRFADVLHELGLPALAAELTTLVIDYVDRTGGALTAPDDHERRLLEVRDALAEAIG